MELHRHSRGGELIGLVGVDLQAGGQTGQLMERGRYDNSRAKECQVLVGFGRSRTARRDVISLDFSLA